jgi:hypothetical protein
MTGHTLHEFLNCINCEDVLPGMLNKTIVWHLHEDLALCICPGMKSMIIDPIQTKSSQNESQPYNYGSINLFS